MLFKDLESIAPFEDENKDPWWNEQFFHRAMEHGFLFDGPILNIAGTPGLCQCNIVDARATNKKLRVWLGWALSRGKWVMHVAGFDADTRTLHEVTCPFDKYFGVVLDDTESEAFCIEYEGI